MVVHDHKPVQHRDGKPPWCGVCGLTEGYLIPKMAFPQHNGEEKMRLNIKRYQVKPDNQEAVEVTKDNMVDIAIWCGGSVMEGMGMEESDTGNYLYIPTISGPISARPGEVVAKDSKGRFNVFDKDRFDHKYEEVGHGLSHHTIRDF